MSRRPFLPRGTWAGVDGEIARLWYGRDVEPEPLPDFTTPELWQSDHSLASAIDCRVVAQAVVEKIDERHLEVVERRIAGETLAEIADDLGISRERVRQIEGFALRRMRRQIEKKFEGHFFRPY